MSSGVGPSPLPVYLSLGANIGERERTIGQALKLIAATPGITLQSVSPLFATEPVGYADQPEFINAAAAIECALEPERLLGRLRAIERHLGRTRRERWREREIDIDILLIGDHLIASPTLTVPHPEMHTRRFVLAPLATIAPEVRHPILGKTITELLARLEDPAAVHPLSATRSHTSTDPT